MSVIGTVKFSLFEFLSIYKCRAIFRLQGQQKRPLSNCLIYLPPALLSLLPEVTSKTLRSHSPIYPIIVHVRVGSNLSSRYFCPTRRRPLSEREGKAIPRRSPRAIWWSLRHFRHVRVAGSSARPARWPRIHAFPPRVNLSPCPLVCPRHPADSRSVFYIVIVPDVVYRPAAR